MNENSRKTDQTLFHRSSVKVLEDKTIVAAPSGKKIWRSAHAAEWQDLSDGMPAGTHTNRLQESNGRLFACTDKGLFRLDGESWVSLDMPMTCYQYKTFWSNPFAATVHGLWCRTDKGWRNTAFSHNPVYDFLSTPHYIFIALDDGIAMYDRLTCTWERFRLRARITGLGVYRSRLLGITDQGEIVQGNLQGGFEKIRYPGMFVFSMVEVRGTVYLCTERGLYRLTELRGQLAAVSVSLGIPVTDLDAQGESLYLATLSEGIQTIDLR